MTGQDWNQLKDLGHSNYTNEHWVDLLILRITVFFLEILKGHQYYYFYQKIMGHTVLCKQRNTDMFRKIKAYCKNI